MFTTDPAALSERINNAFSNTHDAAYNAGCIRILCTRPLCEVLPDDGTGYSVCQEILGKKTSRAIMNNLDRGEPKAPCTLGYLAHMSCMLAWYAHPLPSPALVKRYRGQADRLARALVTPLAATFVNRGALVEGSLTGSGARAASQPGQRRVRNTDYGRIARINHLPQVNERTTRCLIDVASFMTVEEYVEACALLAESAPATRRAIEDWGADDARERRFSMQDRLADAYHKIYLASEDSLPALGQLVRDELLFPLDLLYRCGAFEGEEAGSAARNGEPLPELDRRLAAAGAL